jgi:hypothetical protein
MHAESVNRELSTGDFLQVGNHVFVVEVVNDDDVENTMFEEANELIGAGT